VTVTVAIGPLDHFTITGYPVSTTAGENFASNNIIVTAYDGNNKIKTDYTGQVYFTSTDASAIVPYTSGSNYIFIVGDNGTHTFPGTGFTLKTAGSKTITLTDRTVSVTSNDITVNPASLDHIVILPNTASITAGTTQVYTAKAFDAANNSLGDVWTAPQPLDTFLKK
jgi:adhesin/invasin